MTTVYVVRHAKAGRRDRWEGDDALRPLSPGGLRQAEALAAQLRDAKIERIVSSPYIRCAQTVEPLGASLALSVELDEALQEGVQLGTTFELIRATTAATVLCTHGDVIENLVVALAETGTPGAERMRWKKGSTWVLTLDDDHIERASYVKPPA